MRTAPAFWWRPAGLQACLLSPIGALVGAAAARRMARPPSFRAAVPVICVGNFVAGGAGKTPTAIAIARRAASRGLSPFVLTRGYGGRLAGPELVDPAVHDAGAVGDEALLLARAAPTVVSRDRAAGAAFAAGRGAGLILMDDGFQNPTLAKDASVVVVDGGVGIGNGLCLPAGPLRAPLGVQLEKADLVLVIGGGEDVAAGPAGALIASAAARGIPAASGRLVPSNAGGLAGRRVIGFAGIGRPAKFFETLEQAGAILVGRHAFPDHHPFTEADAAGLLAAAEAARAVLATTAKDHVRLMPGGGPGTPALGTLATSAIVVAVDLVIDRQGFATSGGPDVLDALIDRALDVRSRVRATSPAAPSGHQRAAESS